MVTAAIILIIIGILFGISMLPYVFKEKHIPKALTFSHGIFVAIGLLLLIINALITDHHHKHWESITLFLLAATGGVYLLSRDLRHQKVPKGIVVVHALIALAGITFLLYHILSK